MSLLDLHPNAYGLTPLKHETIVKLARTGLYYEALIADRFGITANDVSEICAADNYVCKRGGMGSNGWFHTDGHELPEEDSQ